MMSDGRLGVIGGGNMAEAILRGVLRAGVLGPEAIVVSEPDQRRREVLSRELGVSCLSDNLAVAAAENILLAVKPQVMGGVLAEIAPAVSNQARVISIAAGTTTAAIDRALGSRGRIVRVMPNTPMLVGAGVSALASGPRATQDDVDWTRRILESAGQVVIVRDDQMDAVTAVSGSGPAYFFYLVEAMVSAGQAEGLDEPTARLLASATCWGAGKLLLGSDDSPADLRRKVTSPGGTTQRAIETMDAAGVQASLVAAVRAAALRSRELSA